MVFLKILCVVLLCLFLLLAFILLINIDLIISVNENGFSFSLRVLGKEIKPKKSPKPKKDNAFLKYLGLSQIESSSAFKLAIKQNGVFETFKGILNRLLNILGRASAAIKHLKILKLNVKFIAGGENAALIYGSACAVVYPFISGVVNIIKTKKNAVNTNISFDFNSDESVFALNLILRLRAFWGVLAAVKILLYARREKANG